ncbi:hypothetical protein FKM82_023380 [Ascaphus truei]
MSHRATKSHCVTQYQTMSYSVTQYHTMTYIVTQCHTVLVTTCVIGLLGVKTLTVTQVGRRSHKITALWPPLTVRPPSPGHYVTQSTRSLIFNQIL